MFRSGNNSHISVPTSSLGIQNVPQHMSCYKKCCHLRNIRYYKGVLRGRKVSDNSPECGNYRRSNLNYWCLIPCLSTTDFSPVPPSWFYYPNGQHTLIAALEHFGRIAIEDRRILHDLLLFILIYGRLWMLLLLLSTLMTILSVYFPMYFDG